ncbi:MAG: DinB family protein [Candidatus Zixiibacteriota bacterium]
MDQFSKDIIRRQFGAAITTMENAIKACPDDLWGKESDWFAFWYSASHCLFWLDYYLTPDRKDYIPPAPFGLEELDPAGVLPPRVYTKDELLTYLNHGRKKCNETIRNMSDELAAKQYKFGQFDISFAELLLYNLRHVQHHAAQLNLLLRQQCDIGSKWVISTAD